MSRPDASRDPAPLLPLTPATFYVLIVLADEERHGYAIIKDVSALTGGGVELGTGTLYGIVKRLLASGLVVESQKRPPAANDDERRRYYRLTPFGRKVVAAEADRLERMLVAVRGRRSLKRV